ncbi:hypothetical protein LCGC14_1141890 [marine sediment metagenome]|uniref:Uncharacterized protein n=1 Tax=marine sediment metagenome TaxID=412755 RepID=A0A0F9ML13_9ZZZZ
MSISELLGLALATVLVIGFVSALIDLFIRLVRGDGLSEEGKDDRSGSEEAGSTDR